MQTNMLKAISKMLDIGTKPTSQDLEIKVQCAKIMLDEIISGLEDSKTDISFTYDPALPTHMAHAPMAVPPTTEQVSFEPMYFPTVDDNKKITGIMMKDSSESNPKDAPLDLPVMLDGKTMTHQTAIGKTFKTIKIL